MSDSPITILKQASLNFYTKQSVKQLTKNQILLLDNLCFTLKTFQITSLPDQILEETTCPRNILRLYAVVKWIHNVVFAIRGVWIYKTLVLDKQTLTGDQLSNVIFTDIDPITITLQPYLHEYYWILKIVLNIYETWDVSLITALIYVNLLNGRYATYIALAHLPTQLYYKVKRRLLFRTILSPWFITRFLSDIKEYRHSQIYS